MSITESLNFAKSASISQLILETDPATTTHKTYKSKHKINSFKLQQQNLMTYEFESESTLYNCLNVKELLARTPCSYR